LFKGESLNEVLGRNGYGFLLRQSKMLMLRILTQVLWDSLGKMRLHRMC
jgi:hypothetical protein